MNRQDSTTQPDEKETSPRVVTCEAYGDVGGYGESWKIIRSRISRRSRSGTQKEATKGRKKRESTSFQGSAQTSSDITVNCNAAVGRSLRKRRLVSLDRLRIQTVELHPQLRCSVFVPGESKLKKELGRSGGK